MMSDADSRAVTLLALLVESRTGMHYGARDRDLLGGKLKEHADQEGFNDLIDFYRSVEYDDPQGTRFNALVDALIVGETYFFRERTGLDRIVELAAERSKRGLRTRIWSAACAGGEEILSLAAMLARANLLKQADLVASDISDKQITRARKGEHAHRSLRNTPEGMPPWITVRDGRPVVDPAIRAQVDWRKINLVDAPAIAKLGAFDAIVCRNVLIYFDEPTVLRVVESLTDALTPGGTLLIGTSESLLRFSTRLECVERRGTFLYNRPGAAR